MLADAVLIYYDFEQLHTGHTILNVWERRFILGIVIVWTLLFMGIGTTGSVFGASAAVRIIYVVVSFADRLVKRARGTDVELSDLEGRSRLLDRVPAGYSEEQVREIVRKYQTEQARKCGCVSYQPLQIREHNARSVFRYQRKDDGSSVGEA